MIFVIFGFLIIPMKEKLTNAALHSAGAVVRHRSKFEDLETYYNQEPVTDAFREKWVIPFYFNLNHSDEGWIRQIKALKAEITEEVILQNLGDFNWRTRSTGAFFAAVQDARHLTEIIGTHLLKSEVCYSGQQYARTLACFNTPEAVDYLNRYLDYYLTLPQLDFDQTSVIAALKYLDGVNGTDHVHKHEIQWNAFVEGKKIQVRQMYDRMKTQFELTEEQTASLDHAISRWTTEIDTAPIAQSVETIRKMQ